VANLDESARRTLFWGLMRAQTTSVVIIAAVAAVIAGSTIGLAAPPMLGVASKCGCTRETVWPSAWPAPR